jgi:hypothetical protein
MLSWQTESLWRHELPVLASAPAFVAAQTIVDIGAGNGAFGRRLASSYPDKRFLGVEPNASIFAVGARSASPPNYRYVHGGFESVSGVHDLLFARLVVMYLPDRQALYEWARRHVRAAIVVNGADAATRTEPAMPLFEAALEEGFRSRREELATTHAGDRDLDDMQAEWAAAGFLPSGSATVVANLHDPDELRLHHHVARLLVAGVNPGALTRELLDELYLWSVDPEARATLAIAYHSVHNPLLAGLGVAVHEASVA